MQTRALGSRYRLEELIGVGAMGSVYRALETENGRYVAAKVLKPEYTQDPEVVGRFVQERSILLTLQHENIVTVHDLVVDGGDLAIVMDLVEGKDLREHLRERGTFAPAEAVAITSTLLDALAYAHQQNCLHRDIKPDNVLVAGSGPGDPGALRLSDFSISRLADASTVKATGLLGTPEYMPPELFADGTFSAASDVYAMGILLYELLAGRTPFAGSGNAFTIGNRHVGSMPPALPLPAPLWQVLSGMLDKDARRRLNAAGTAAALRELDLRDVAALPVQDEPATWTPAGPVAASAATGYVPAISDVGATQVKVGDIGEAVVLPVTAGDAVALAPGAEGLEVGQTAVVARTAKHVAPRVEARALPANPGTLEGASVRTKVMIALGVLVAVAVVIVLVVQLRPSGAGDGSGSASGSAGGDATMQAIPSGSGLSIGATASAAGSGIEATFTLSYSGDSTVTGPFLISLPRPSDPTECVKPADGLDWGTFSGSLDSDANSAVSTTKMCAYEVGSESDTLSGGSSLQIPLSIDLKAPKDLQKWLEAVYARTQLALKSFPNSSQRYAPQRITGFDVRAVPDAPQQGQMVELRVFPRWVSGKTSSVPMLATETTGAPGPALLALGGTGYQLSANCPGNPLELPNGKRVKALHFSAEPCAVLVTIPGLTAVPSEMISVSDSGSS